MKQLWAHLAVRPFYLTVFPITICITKNARENPGVSLCSKGLYLLLVDPREEEQRSQQAHYFRNGESPPDHIYITAEAQKVSCRQQYHQLAAQRGNGGVHAVTQGLERSAQGDAHGCHREVDADDPKSGLAQLHKGVGQLKDAQQHLGISSKARQPAIIKTRAVPTATFSALVIRSGFRAP